MGNEIIVIKRDGRSEEFSVDKIAVSIMGAAAKFGGEDYELAEQIAEDVVGILEDNNIYKVSAQALQDIVEKELIEQGHAKTAKEYIINSQNRNRVREMNSALMKSLEDLTFSDTSEVKKENANIDSDTAMGTMLKYGSEAAKKFNLMYLMSDDVAQAHQSGDIHIHDLDFFALTETCISKDTVLTVKKNNKTYVITAEQLADYCEIEETDKWKKVYNIQILSNGRFVDIKSIVKHKSSNKHMMCIETPTGKLNVTSEHRVSVIDNRGLTIDKPVCELKKGDIISVPSMNINAYTDDKLDIISLYDGNNLVISNTRDIIENIKHNNKWLQFVNVLKYNSERSHQIISNHSKMTINEYKLIQSLCTLDHSDLKLQHKWGKCNETINAVLPLNFELGNFIGIMYSKGKIIEQRTDDKNRVNVKRVSLSSRDETIVNKFIQDYKAIFNNANVRGNEYNDKCTRALMPGTLQFELFQGVFGVKINNTIKMAPWIISANREFISGLLDGIIEGAGELNKNKNKIKITSVSKEFITDLQKLLLLRGIPSAIKYRESTSNLTRYHLEINGKLANGFRWVPSDKLKGLSAQALNGVSYKYTTISNIEEIEYKGFVYDIETEDNHFTANGFNVHNCCQIPLDKLFKGGFNTGHGFLREPGGIQTAAALAAIAIQSNQNDQHGGQSVPMFDYYLAPYVDKTYVKNIAHTVAIRFYLDEDFETKLKNKLIEYQKTQYRLMNEEGKKNIKNIVEEALFSIGLRLSEKDLESVLKRAMDDTYECTFQAMESFIHNLNTMHCLPASEKIWVLDAESQDFKAMTMEELNSCFKPNKYKVVSLNKKTGKAEFKFITHCKKMDNNRKIIKLTDNQGRSVRVTDNHRIMTMNGIEITEDIPANCKYTVSPRGIQLPAAKFDICVSDYGKPRANNAFQSDHILINESFAEFIGYYMADGCMLGNTSTCCITACGKVTFEEMVELLQNAFGCKFKTSYTYFEHSKNGNTEKDIRIQLGMPLAKMIADKFGRTWYTKKIPVELMFAPKDIIKSFLRAYFKLDGRSGSKYSEIQTVNKGLQEQVAFMLSSLGVSAHYCTSQNSGGFKGKNGKTTLYGISLSGNDSRIAGIKCDNTEDTKFEIPKYNLKSVYEKYPEQCDKITGRRKSKNLGYNELCELIDSYGIGKLTPLENIFINDIESKEELNSGDEYVYDISVEDNESFLTAECIFVHNSRAGAQVPFSSINYGTDTSVEGRMVIETLLKTTEEGLGNGETPIFPIQIWKMKKGVSAKPGDPNYDLFELACKVSAKRLYPNFSNLDAPYNAEIYIEGKPETEVAYMGCRTRVATNVYDPSKAIIPGRGNLSFTSINLPRIAIEANHDIDKFFEMLKQKMELVHKELLERFEVQCNKHPINFPFLMGQGVWIDSEKLEPNDNIREILKNGTLSVGFIGLAETLVALIGEHHGQSEKAQELGLKIVRFMRNCTDTWSREEHLNYSVIGTPAEGLSGRFVKLDKERYGIIPGVTDKDYYTNSSHVPVSFPISATKKIEIEAPYHALENGGHILYIEMNGDPLMNMKAYIQIVQYMYDNNAGYFAINHPVDRDPVCGYVGIINDVCPRCGRREGEAMSEEMWQRIKGYANVGNADTCGACGNPDEERDRIPNTVDNK